MRVRTLKDRDLGVRYMLVPLRWWSISISTMIHEFWVWGVRNVFIYGVLLIVIPWPSCHAVTGAVTLTPSTSSTSSHHHLWILNGVSLVLLSCFNYRLHWWLCWLCSDGVVLNGVAFPELLHQLLGLDVRGPVCWWGEIHHLLLVLEPLRWLHMRRKEHAFLMRRWLWSVGISRHAWWAVSWGVMPILIVAWVVWPSFMQMLIIVMILRLHSIWGKVLRHLREIVWCRHGNWHRQSLLGLNLLHLHKLVIVHVRRVKHTESLHAMIAVWSLSLGWCWSLRRTLLFGYKIWCVHIQIWLVNRGRRSLFLHG